MQIDIDTADIIRYCGEEFTVACAHITHFATCHDRERFGHI